MSHKLIEKARKRLQNEQGPRSNPWGGRLSVALVYPNHYHQAMSNLGFQWVYHYLNSREDVLCERFFLPDPEDLTEHRNTGYPLFSLESGHFLNDFDVVAFSISFENDYLHLPVLFELARIPLYAEERQGRFPLLMCGGVCAFLNPEPLADIMDLFSVGEGEVILPGVIDLLLSSSQDRTELLEKVARLPGVYVPSLYSVRYRDDGLVVAYQAQKGAPSRVRRRWLNDLGESQVRTFCHTEDTEFGDMTLVEISRGCARGCRFCAAGYIYLPSRERTPDQLDPQVAEGLLRRQRIGLVSAAVSDHSEIGAIQKGIADRGGKMSVASLRIDSLTSSEVDALRESGHRTCALAPEAGSQRLRNLINKGLNEDQILQAVRMLTEGGIPSLKLYFLIGLPTETDDDIAELLQLAEKVRSVWLQEGKKRGRLGQLTLSVNPFIPKPFTPLQWAGMAATGLLKKRCRMLRSGVARMANTEVIFESLRSAELQALLSRGDRRTGRILPALASGDTLRSACRLHGLEPDFFVTRQRGEEELFPWEVIDNGVTRDYLWREYRRALKGELSPPCSPGCRRCGVCGNEGLS
ncbi:MAG: radical SAM protein [Syntrophotaleaceae bacterium]